jgi:peptidoglycan L-alanyl-D-glutamate endopeptidase CwlK
MTIRKASVAAGTPAQLKQLVAESDGDPKVTNQDVINYLAKGTTVPQAWVKAKSFGIDPNRLVADKNGANARQREFLPGAGSAGARPAQAKPTCIPADAPAKPPAAGAPAKPPAAGAPAPKPGSATPTTKPTNDDKPSLTPGDLQADVAVALNKNTKDVTNQDVINTLSKTTRSFDEASDKAARYGVNLGALAKDPETRKAIFDGSAVRTSGTVADAKANAALLKQLNGDIADLTKQLPKELRDKISANVADIHTNAEKIYDVAISKGKTDDAARADRRAYVTGELTTRGVKLDADIQDLLSKNQLDPKYGPVWNELKGQLKNPDIYTRAVEAREQFEDISKSLSLVDKTYKTKDPDKVEQTPATPLTPGVAVSSQSLTAVEKNYLATMKEDPLFAKRILGTAGFYKGPLNGQWDSKVEQAAMEAVNQYRETRAKYGPLDSRSEAAIITLHPNAQAAARQVVNQMNAEFARQGNGQTAKVLWGTRTYAQQNALFNQRPKVTNARGGQSNHNFGIAFDIGIFKGTSYLTNDGPYRAAHNVVNVPGTSWGGNWKSIQDTPHYQLTIRGKEPNISEMRGLLESGQPLPVAPLPAA